MGLEFEGTQLFIIIRRMINEIRLKVWRKKHGWRHDKI